MLKQLLLGCILCFLLISCRKGQEIDRFLLTDEQLAFVPYEQGQLIPFVHSNGYPFAFEVVEKQRYLESNREVYRSSDYVSFEMLSVRLRSNEPDLEFYLSLASEQMYYGVQGSLNNWWFYREGISKPDFDSLLVNNKIYRDVFVFTQDWQDTTVISFDSLFYSRTDGLIKIGMSNHEAYFLNP